MSKRLAEAERITADLVRWGRVAEVDLDAARCVVDFGDFQSGPLPWLAPRAGQDIVWDPPSVGEQAVVLAAEGDLEAGLVLAGVFSDSIIQELGDARGRSGFWRIFRDGARLYYDPEDHVLFADLPDGARAAIRAPGGLDIEADVRIRGKLSVDGPIDATGDVVAMGVSLAKHPHDKVQPGTGLSGKPVAS